MGGTADRPALGLLDTVVAEIPGAEHRAGQREMAAHIALAIDRSRPLVVGAGTGTGKTLAYLIPAIASGTTAVVVTATKALQDQLPDAEVAGEFVERTDKPILRISRRHHGNVKSSIITQDFVHGADYGALATAAETFRGLLGEGAKAMRGEGDKQKEERVGDFRQAMQWLISEAERTTSRQRYKGLGEMNPAQLWETTMDPTVRRLLRVQMDDANEADRVFTMLMGDEVEPRRDFIESNALRAGNIDV